VWRELLGHPRARLAVGVVALAVVYRGMAEIGYTLQFAGPVAAIVWLPVGAGIAFLYLGGLAFWPGVLIGDLLANDYHALPLGSAVGQTCGNVLEVIVATLLLRRLVPDRDPLGRVDGVGRLLAAIFVATVVSATVGCSSLLAGGVIAADELPEVWRTWWLGDASGALIVVPLALAWAAWPLRRRGRPLEMALLLVAIAVLSYLALSSREPYTYLVFPALLWAALRFGPRGATAAVAIAAGFAIWETTRREGPFALASTTGSVLATQLFIAVAAISTLCVAAVVSEREAFSRRLAASRTRLVEAATDERRRIERDLHDGAQQRLTALLVRLSLGVERARDDPASAVGRLQAAEIELSAAIDELRELAHGIHPSVVTDHGLARALRLVAGGSLLPVRLLELPEGRVDPAAEMSAYFVACEAITNARKHSGATAIDVRAVAADGVLCVEIADDGVGGASERAGSGIQGLRDRVDAVGGTFRLSSPPGGGTRIVAELPIGYGSGTNSRPLMFSSLWGWKSHSGLRRERRSSGSRSTPWWSISTRLPAGSRT
jgi:signal transduction histidine kinase